MEDLCAHRERGVVLGTGASVDGLTSSAAPVLQTEFQGPLLKVATATQDCVLGVDGAVSCRGQNADGMLGNGSRADSVAPLPVTGLSSGVVDIKAFDSSTYALRNDGTVWGWGSVAGVGSGFLERALVPARLLGLDGRFVAQIDGEVSFFCALGQAGEVSCWGAFPSDGPEFPYVDTPTLMPELGEGNAQVAVGQEMLCVRKMDGMVFCAGLNRNGQLGDGTGVNNFNPAPVVGLPAAAAEIDAGTTHVCARLVDETVWCWGGNFFGQLGVGDKKDRLRPEQVRFPGCLKG